jgi:hypothetical protein
VGACSGASQAFGPLRLRQACDESMLIPPQTPLDFAIFIEEVLPEIAGAQDEEPETCAECGDLLEDGYCVNCDPEVE